MSVSGCAFPRRIEKPQMVEYVLLQYPLYDVLIGLALELTDDVEAFPNDLVIARGFYGIYIGQMGKKQIQMGDVYGLQGRERVIHLERFESQNAIGV